ncbi:MAG: TatD family hydrolase [Sedimentisphaerales bacterium]|nr:TatD family hydrolase [Sedimentisphaerales bacterium]
MLASVILLSMIELIDTHSHLVYEPLAGDIENVLARSREAGVAGWINVGTDPEHNQKAVDMACKFENMYAAIGVHPHYADQLNGEIVTELKQLAANEKVIAIGETGLDFHYNLSKKSEQRRTFEAHLHIAREMNLPVIIHTREAFDDTMEILDNFIRLNGNLKGVVFHCYSETAERARIILDYGFYASFTGVVTFKNADTIRKAAQVVPVERMMIETDCPYMSPEPMRKQKVNEPALMIHMAKYLAELKNMELEDFAAAVTQTSKSFFDLPL